MALITLLCIGVGGGICTQLAEYYKVLKFKWPYPYPIHACMQGVGGTLVSRARPSHSAAFSSFRINARKEGLAHCPCAFGSMLCKISKRDAKERDVIQIFAQRCWPKRQIGTALAIVPSFSMVENINTVGQLSKLLMMCQLFTG